MREWSDCIQKLEGIERFGMCECNEHIQQLETVVERCEVRDSKWRGLHE